jgi:15-cis-phytoene synthase
MQVRSPDSILASSADHAACRALIRAGSKSFFAASLLLPSAVREPALALYAFCRLADDAVDNPDTRTTELTIDPLSRLRERLALAYAGRPLATPADRAFADVITRYAIPKALPEALLEGFEWDTQGKRYEDGPQLNAYAARVAGSVGAMMACLMDVRDPRTVARACDLGVAMQLTNIARDVGEDARAGRLYLPLNWLRDAGVDPDIWTTRPVFTPAIGKVIARLLEAADALYLRGASGISRLPRNCRRGIQAARFLYAEIGHELQRNGLDSVSRRTVVPLTRKAAVLARAVVVRTLAVPEAGIEADEWVPLEQTRFLVDAVIAGASPVNSGGRAQPVRGLDQRVEWLVNLFERLERRDRLSRPDRVL